MVHHLWHRRGSILGYVLVERRGEFEVLSPPRRLRSRLELVAVWRGLVDASTCRAALDALRRQPADCWHARRHHEHPTTDCELWDALPWLDEQMAAKSLPTLLGALARTYGIEPSSLWLRELFCVRCVCVAARRPRPPTHLPSRLGRLACRYTPHGQPSLETHRDASVLSFVIPLTDEGTDHRGGGTTFDGRRAPHLSPGDALLFCGRRLHGAAPVLHGERYVLAGFVDVRVGLGGLRRLSSMLHALDPSAEQSSCRELPRPYLRSNLHELERRAGKSGRALVAGLAARRVRVPHVDIEPLAAGCAAYLAGDEAAVDVTTRRFIECACACERAAPNRKAHRREKKGRTRPSDTERALVLPKGVSKTYTRENFTFQLDFEASRKRTRSLC